jgi:hypothetical protein
VKERANMRIRDMFERDINRNINGVVQVSDERSVAQELDEYVVTSELRRHFSDFFDAYTEALDTPTDRIGVWVSGYFGSGKSHFIKILSYLLENPVVAGKRAIDYFEGKIQDPLVAAQVRRAAEVPTESLLFNVDAKGGGWKEGDTSKTALLRTFARVFYDHLGFYGTDYKLATFEKMIDDKGATQRFRESYERIAGTAWLEDRDAYEFHSEEIAQAASEAAGLSAGDVEKWIDSDSQVTLSPEDLVADIKSYVDGRKAEEGGSFRLLFMADEVGQFIGSDTNLMLNLQTIVELLGSECMGSVWVVVTSQEAIDEMRTIVENDFSKIQGRFATRLSLSSTSVDEVIKRRVLAKNDAAVAELRGEHSRESAVLRNLFSFEHSEGDLCGYLGERDFVDTYPFAGYQFTLMPEVLNQIRLHGYSGKHISTGERSMLSAFQESAQTIADKEDGALVPFWRFFDTLERQLDHGVKQVFERCRRAAKNRQGLQPWDVDVLKALYLVVYIPQQIEPSASNVAILMADSIDVDTLALRESVKESLERLCEQNYVSRSGGRYTYLTDQQQDVEREIRATQIDSSDVLERIKGIIFDDLYTQTKLRKGANDFPIDCYVDESPHGRSQNGMRLDIITVANELSEVPDAELAMRSSGQALVVLSSESDYYDLVQGAAKVRRYVQGINRETLPDEKRKFVEAKQRQASEDVKAAKELISQAIVSARTAVDGQLVSVPATTAKSKLDAVLDLLASSVFTKADLVDKPLSEPAQLEQALSGRTQTALDPSDAPNARAAEDMSRYLDAQDRTHQSVNFDDLQRHYQEKPYGWRQDDVSLVLALLVGQQKATVSYAGATLPSRDPKLKQYLTNQSSFAKITVKIRKGVPTHIITGAKQLLREIDRQAQIPGDEDGLVEAIAHSLANIGERCGALKKRYRMGRPYPGEDVVREVSDDVEKLLSGSREPEAFLRSFNSAGGDLADGVEDLATVESFFKTQEGIFDQAIDAAAMLGKEAAYFEGDQRVTDALSKINEILKMREPYKRIHELEGLRKAALGAYEETVGEMRTRTAETIRIALDEVTDYAGSQKDKAPVPIEAIIRDSGIYARGKRLEAEHEESCTRLDAISSQARAWSDQQSKKVDDAVRAEAERKARAADPGARIPPVPQRHTRVLSRVAVCPTKLLESEEAIDEYVREIREKLVEALREDGSVRLG